MDKKLIDEMRAISAKIDNSGTNPKKDWSWMSLDKALDAVYKCEEGANNFSLTCRAGLWTACISRLYSADAEDPASAIMEAVEKEGRDEVDQWHREVSDEK